MKNFYNALTFPDMQKTLTSLIAEFIARKVQKSKKIIYKDFTVYKIGNWVFSSRPGRQTNYQKNLDEMELSNLISKIPSKKTPFWMHLINFLIEINQKIQVLKKFIRFRRKLKQLLYAKTLQILNKFIKNRIKPELGEVKMAKNDSYNENKPIKTA